MVGRDRRARRAGSCQLLPIANLGPRITLMNANQKWRPSLDLLKRNSWEALERLVGWIDDDSDGFERRHAQERLCSRSGEDHAACSSFSHEFNSDQAKRILPDGAVG